MDIATQKGCLRLSYMVCEQRDSASPNEAEGGTGVLWRADADYCVLLFAKFVAYRNAFLSIRASLCLPCIFFFLYHHCLPLPTTVITTVSPSVITSAATSVSPSAHRLILFTASPLPSSSSPSALPLPPPGPLQAHLTAVRPLNHRRSTLSHQRRHHSYDLCGT